MGAIFNAPVLADGLSANGGRQDDFADEVGGLAGRPPEPGRRGAGQDVTRDADNGADMIGPFGAGQVIAWGEHLDQPQLISGMALLVDRVRTVERRLAITQRGDRVMQGRLVSFDLRDQMDAACSGLLERFFGNAWHRR